MVTATGTRFGFALEYVKDVQAARSFFVDVLGLEVHREHPSFVEFKAADGASYAIASDEPMAPPNGPELWWVVNDAQAAYSRMAAKAQVTVPLRQMPFGTCFGIQDGDGQTHYVLELAADRPSQVVS